MASAPQVAGIAVFAFFFCLYALTASPAMGWLDSPEFVAQALTLGVAHSPGHPLVGLLGYAGSLIPVGDAVWRVNLMSSLCAALTVMLLFACAHRVLAGLSPRVSRRSSLLLALSVAAAFGGSWALWSNAVRAEVYALQALLSVGALHALLRYEQAERPRDLLLAALLLALGLANHHLMSLLILLPAAVFVLWRKQRPSLRLAAQSFGLGVLGLCALLYLPVRSLAHPLVNFGAPHSLERFFWTLRGAAFSKSVGQEHASPPMMDALQIAWALFEAVTVPLMLLAFLGIGLGLGQRHRRFTLLLSGILLLTVAARVALGFDPETPDHHAYLLPAIFALYLLAVAGLARLCNMALTARRPLPKAPALTALAVALLVPIQLFGNEGRANQASSFASDDLAHWSVEGLPPRSVVLSAYFQTRFRLWALQAVEGSRPDLAILDRSFLTYPGMAGEARARYPELADLIDSPLRAGQPSPMALLQRLQAERPIYAELHPNLDGELAAALSPMGAFARFGAAGPDHVAADREARVAVAERMADASPAESRDARAALLWHDATRLSHYCFLGKRSAAAKVYADALQLAPDDHMLDAMASACGLKKR